MLNAVSQAGANKLTREVTAAALRQRHRRTSIDKTRRHHSFSPARNIAVGGIGAANLMSGSAGEA